jgi:hypothetical protein
LTEIGLPPPHKTTHQDGGSDEINIAGLAGGIGLDQAPVDGEITKGIASNWAYDHKENPSAHHVRSNGYVNRGDPAGWDFDITGFGTAWEWTALDLSGIIAAGAYAVHIMVTCRTTTANEEIMFRKHGNSNEANMSELRPMVASLYDVGEFIVALSSDGKIDYNKYGSHFDSISLVVKGWFI